ncbi:hypothetical protein GCM10010193_02810 [Kitasatospora atroaurantiaca]|uniref:Uncharacterized protein n=1 Tax=Kitasatospora atroaurantiaca TaxID=285545 RepID=A0A561ELR1_9ACTN|nr:hypothetical protein [Kitasatospora atroaurantiaca]TWE16502.1 hypothetical protein FB465_1484 [Kitasatospora atroaurantiaca]
MSQSENEQPGPAEVTKDRAGRIRLAAAAAVGALVLVAVAGWATAGQGPTLRNLPAVVQAAPSAASATPDPAPSPSPSPSLSLSPSPGAEPTTEAPAPAAATTTRRATKKPATEISPGTDNCNCNGVKVAPGPSCARNAAGEIMTCDPVRSLTPMPRPSPSGSTVR